ncbi:unnamed protein product [Orchesella dallaii]|uniref:Terpene synthase n=1 Tax=Orchesella dallaii TaxID=48710 RepID=A0ABP1Q931_9HEXA
MEKFGQVFIRKRAENSSKLELIPSARFSNLNHKWYNSDANVHSEFAKHNGKKFSLSFQTNQNDKSGLLVPFQGNFNVPLNLGETCNQDFEGIETADKKDIGIIRSYNLVSDETTDGIDKKFFEQTAFLAACYPSTKLCDPNTLQRIFFLAFFAFDDHLESLFDYKFDALDTFLKYATKIIKNKIEITKILTPTNENVPEILWKYLNYIECIESKLTKEENGRDRGKYFRQALQEHLHANVVEICYEWNAQQKNLFVKAQKELRIVASGAIICLEVGLYDAGIEVKDEIRNTFLFKWFIRLYTQYFSWTNDIISYQKEVDSGRAKCNTVYLLHYHNGLPLKDAMQKVQDKINARSTLLVEVGEMLKTFYTFDENLQRCVHMVKQIAYGNVQWFGITERYHQEFRYDCVLE